MTEILIKKIDEKIVYYKARGHSNYADNGEDIVCAALSVAMQLPLMGLQTVLDLKPLFVVNDDGFLEVDIRKTKINGKEKEIETLFASMYLVLLELSNQYPNYVKLIVEEGKENVI